MLRKVIFQSKCPSCDNNDEFIVWRHHDCGGAYNLYTDGDMVCQHCHQNCNLLDIKLACGKHECLRGFYDDNNRLKNTINLIIKKMDIDDDFKVELLYNITMRRHQFN